MSIYADLHMHTYFSDGTQSPEEIVRSAREKGLSVISVCDHDTVAAYDRLRPACEAAGVRLIQGVEIDVYWGETQLHLLAYNFDPGNAPMSELLSTSRAELDQISVEVIKAMEMAGRKVSLADYDAYEMPLGRGGWKGINYLLDRSFIDSLDDWMQPYREYGGYRPEFYPIDEACHIIKAAAGIPVLAHPGNWWPDTPPELRSILSDLKSRGIEGIECYYPSHSSELTAFCADFCRANDMRITCGGDGHGEFSSYVNGVEYGIGIVRADMDSLDLKGII